MAVRLMALAAVWLVPSFVSAQETVPASPYFPAEVGTEWVYQAGPVEVVERIARHEKVGGEICARVETSLNGKVVAFEHVAVRADGLYRVSIGGQEIKPPLRFAKFPPQLNDTWRVDSQVLGQTITGTFQTTRQQVEVPAGDFDTLTVQGKDFKNAGTELAFTYHFAANVGKVKQVISAGEHQAVLSLKEYRPVK